MLSKKEIKGMNKAISKLDFDGGYNEQSFISDAGEEVEIIIYRLFDIAIGQWLPWSSIEICIDHGDSITDWFIPNGKYYPKEGYDKKYLINRIKRWLEIMKQDNRF